MASVAGGWGRKAVTPSSRIFMIFFSLEKQMGNGLIKFTTSRER